MDLNDLNCFERLIHLELEGVKLEEGQLSLRKLKVVLLEEIDRNTTDFELNCPQLEALTIGYATEPRLTQETSDSIRHLFVKAYSSEDYLLSLYRELKNLSTITFDGCRSLNRFVLELIGRKAHLPSLKRIKFGKESAFLAGGELLKNLLKLKNRPETKHIQINWKVMRLDELTEVLDLLSKLPPGSVTKNGSFGFPNHHLLRHFSENPTLACLLPGVLRLDLKSDEEVR